MCTVHVDLTAPERSKFGKHIYNLYYKYRLKDLLDLAPGRNGCSHSGGFHSLSIDGPIEDVKAWLDLFAEAFPETHADIYSIKKCLLGGKQSVALRHITFFDPDTTSSKLWFYYDKEKGYAH